MTPEQKTALQHLANAFEVATRCGLLDELQFDIGHVDSINDVSDTITDRVKLEEKAELLALIDVLTTYRVD